MPITYVVTPEVLSHFKEPFGILLKGTSAQTAKRLKALLAEEQPPMLIAVGDTVSNNLEKHGIPTHLSITDNKTHRRRVRAQSFQDKAFVKVKNPPGVITPEALAAIREAISGPKAVHLLVEGEEDLLTLIAALYAPENSFVLYGQPHEGLVAVKITPEKRAQAKKILKEMKTVKEKG